jgi:hypothetical protein
MVQLGMGLNEILEEHLKLSGGQEHTSGGEKDARQKICKFQIRTMYFIICNVSYILC